MIQEVQDDLMDSQIALLFVIIAIMAILYSAMNLINLWSKNKR